MISEEQGEREGNRMKASPYRDPAAAAPCKRCENRALRQRQRLKELVVRTAAMSAVLAVAFSVVGVVIASKYAYERNKKDSDVSAHEAAAACVPGVIKSHHASSQDVVCLGSKGETWRTKR